MELSPGATLPAVLCTRPLRPPGRIVGSSVNENFTPLIRLSLSPFRTTLASGSIDMRRVHNLGYVDLCGFRTPIREIIGTPTLLHLSMMSRSTFGERIYRIYNVVYSVKSRCSRRFRQVEHLVSLHLAVEVELLNSSFAHPLPCFRR